MAPGPGVCWWCWWRGGGAGDTSNRSPSRLPAPRAAAAAADSEAAAAAGSGAVCFNRSRGPPVVEALLWPSAAASSAATGWRGRQGAGGDAGDPLPCGTALGTATGRVALLATLSSTACTAVGCACSASRAPVRGTATRSACAEAAVTRRCWYWRVVACRSFENSMGLTPARTQVCKTSASRAVKRRLRCRHALRREYSSRTA